MLPGDSSSSGRDCGVCPLGCRVSAGQAAVLVRGQVPELGEGWGQSRITKLLCVGQARCPFPGQGCCMPAAPTPETALPKEMGAPPVPAIYLGRNRGIFCIFDKAALYKRLTLY